MAEIELSVLSRQCLNRRIPDMTTLKEEVATWCDERNGKASWIEGAIYNRRCTYKTKRDFTPQLIIDRTVIPLLPIEVRGKGLLH